MTAARVFICDQCGPAKTPGMTASDGPTVAMVMIARDEQDNVHACFSSFWDHVDQVVLCDTGSRDQTVNCARAFAVARGTPEKLIVTHHAWDDDFASARNHADRCATTDWVAWCDLDDTIVGAEHLRTLAAEAPENIVAYVCEYDYAHHPSGACACRHPRERLLRAGRGTWHGTVHEGQVFEGDAARVPRGVIRWVHRRDVTRRATRRNIRLLQRALQRDPDNLRALTYLATEHLARRHHRTARRLLRRALAHPDSEGHAHAQLHRKLGICLLAEGDAEGARRVAGDGVSLAPDWAENYLTLAQAAYETRRPADAASFARRVLDLGAPDTMLILNPLDFTFEPRLVLAGALAALGQLDDAIRVAEEASEIIPDHPGLTPAYESWRAQRKRTQTAETWLHAAQVLVSHDEQLKALDLLERTVPYWVVDDPRVVALRSQLRERLAWASDPASYAEHYETGGSRPEDFLDDETAREVAGRLPRCAFLAEQVSELAQAA